MHSTSYLKTFELQQNCKCLVTKLLTQLSCLYEIYYKKLNKLGYDLDSRIYKGILQLDKE